MADLRNPPPASGRSISPWALVLAAFAVIALGVLFFNVVGVDDPVPTPDSPAATGTAGEPAGVTGTGPQPGAPVGAEAPAGSPTVPPATATLAPAPTAPAASN